MIRVESKWLEHSGGTKFYQVFMLMPEEGKPVTVCHWGKMTIAAGKRNVRPVLGGETQLHEGAVMASKVNNKIKRGYDQADMVSMNVEDDSEWFVQHFGADLAARIEIAMFHDKVAIEHNVMTAAPTPKVAPDTTSIGKTKPAEPTPEGWGSW